MDHLGFLAENVGDLLGVERLVADGVVNLVEHDEVPVAGKDGPGGLAPRLFNTDEGLWDRSQPPQP